MDVNALPAAERRTISPLSSACGPLGVRLKDDHGWLWMWYCHAVFGGKPPRAMIPSGLFDHMRRRGMPVFFLGVNDDRDIEVRARAGLVPRPKAA